MFNVWEVTTFLTLIIYGFLYNTPLLLVFLSIFTAYHILGHLLTKKDIQNSKNYKPSVRRTIRISTWDPPRDSNCLSKYEIDMDKMRKWLKKANNRKGRSSTDSEIKVNHVLLKTIAKVMKSCPKDFGKIIWGKFVPVEDVDISMLVDINGNDLAAHLVTKCDKLGIQALANQLKGKIGVVKRN